MDIDYRRVGYYCTQTIRIGGIFGAMGVSYLGFHGESGIDGFPVAFGYACVAILAIFTDTERIRKEWNLSSLEKILEKN
jgi:hypothetical protein